jgi:LysR family transcriptional regulator, pca operon transcriptional activator
MHKCFLRIIPFVAGVALALLPMVAAFAQELPPLPDAIKKQGVLRAGVKCDYPPDGFLEYAPAAPDAFAREAIWTEPISILARTEHPVFSEEEVTVDALRRYELVLPTVSQRVGQEIEHLLAHLGLQPTTSLRSSSYGFIREMLHATDLIAVMPRLMMVGDLLRGTLKVVPLPIPAPDRPAGLILPRDRAVPPAGRAFIACLRTYVSEIAERGLADRQVAHSTREEPDMR